MRRFLFLIATVVFSVSAISAQAAGEASASLTRVLGGINAMQASFAQNTTDAKGRNLPVQTGKMSAKRPGMFRWEVLKPSPQMVLTTGKLLWIYDPELMQATKQKLDEQATNTPALLLSGDPHKLDAAFVISEETAKGSTEQVFVLKPRDKEALFEKLRVRFKGSELFRMELTDTLGQTTDIRFSDIRVNPALPASQFEFTPGKGVDVIDQM